MFFVDIKQLVRETNQNKSKQHDWQSFCTHSVNKAKDSVAEMQMKYRKEWVKKTVGPQVDTF